MWEVWKPAVLTWVKKPAPSSTAMLTWLPLFLSPLTVKTSETWAQSHVPSCPPADQSYTLSLTQSASSVLILTSRANIPLRGKSKVPSAQVTEWEGGGKKGKMHRQIWAPEETDTRTPSADWSIWCAWDGGTVGRRTEVKLVGERGEEKGSIWLSEGE